MAGDKYKADVFSLAMIALEIGGIDIANFSMLAMTDPSIIKAKVDEFAKKFSPELSETIGKMMRLDPANRPGFLNLLVLTQ